MFSLVKNMATATTEEMILPKSFGTNPYQFKSIHSWLVSAELVLALKARVLEHGISYHLAPFDFSKIDNRQVAIIKIWNPETDQRKVPKLFFRNYFWKLFRKPKLHFQKNKYFHGIGL